MPVISLTCLLTVGGAVGANSTAGVRKFNLRRSQVRNRGKIAVNQFIVFNELSQCILIVLPCILIVVYVYLLLSMYTYCCLCILIVVCVFLLLPMYTYCCLCILIVVYVYLLLSMYYCCLSILIVRPCILIVVYIYVFLSTYS